jgi:hypothetical protein
MCFDASAVDPNLIFSDHIEHAWYARTWFVEVVPRIGGRNREFPRKTSATQKQNLTTEFAMIV